MGYKSVCLDCRISFSYGMDYSNNVLRVCPQCKKQMINADYKLMPPKKNDIKKWAAIKYFFENGFYFQHIYENNETLKYPENMRDAKIFVEKYNSQKINGLYGC
jgi:hypothetical protein